MSSRPPQKPKPDAFSMSMIYESNDYIVVHTRYSTHQPGKGFADVFEIVDKTREMEVLLSGDLAQMFDFQIAAWKKNTPSQCQVDAVLCGYAELANIPILEQ